jgi:hypothetical protein
MAVAAITTMQQEAAEEVDMLAANIEGRLTAKVIDDWKEAVASYVRSSIFPRKQWVKDHEIQWGSGIQKIICMKTLGRYSPRWEEFWEEQGGMEVVRKTIGRRRQSSADGQKKNFRSEYMVVLSESIAVWNLMPVLYCNVEWMEAANRNGRNGTEQVVGLEPPKPEKLEMEMRTNSKQYIQFVTRMLPPVYGKEIWNEAAGKTKLSEFVTASQEAFALLLYKNGYEAWSWMLSDTSSSSDGDGNEAPEVPTFKYTSRSNNRVTGRNSGWTVEGLTAFNTLYGMVTKDREENGEVFDEALLYYYEERNTKKRRRAPIEDRGKRQRLKICDDLAGLVEETLESNTLPLGDEEIGAVVVGV